MRYVAFGRHRNFCAKIYFGWKQRRLKYCLMSLKKTLPLTTIALRWPILIILYFILDIFVDDIRQFFVNQAIAFIQMIISMLF